MWRRFRDITPFSIGDYNGMNDDIIEKNLFSLFSRNYFVDTHSIHLDKKNSMSIHNIYFC